MPPFNPTPPRLARLLLRLRPLGTRRAEVTADLDEVFAERAAAEGAGRAARRYYHDVLSLWTWNLTGRRLLGDAVQDLSHGLRVFRRNPGAVAITVLGLSLAIIGIYGVTTFVTGQRTREIGLRIAVGASRADVMRLLLWDGLRPVAIGLAAGAGVALLASQLFAGILYGVGPRDPLAFASAIGILLVAAAAAVFIPARRAASVDPAFVLRQS